MRVEGVDLAPARAEYAPKRLERSQFRAAMAAATWAAVTQRVPGEPRFGLVATEPVAPDGPTRP